MPINHPYLASIKPRDPWLLGTIALCCAAFAWMEVVSWNNWMIGRWYLADVGNVYYMLVETLHGRFMFSPMVQTNHYAYHFTPLLTLLSPLALFSDYAHPLVGSYNLALALCPLPLYRLGREMGLPGAICMAVGVLFLGNHFTGSIHLACHFESYLVFAMLWMMAYFAHGQNRTFWLSATVALAVKEDAALWVSGFAAWAWFFGPANQRRRALLLGLFAVLYLAGAAAVIWLVGRTSDGNASWYLERAAGISMGAAPIKSIALLLLSACGISLFGGSSLFLFLLPTPLLFTQFEMMRELRYYYSYPFLPFLFFSLLFGLRRILQLLNRQPRPAAGAAVAAALVLAGVGQAWLPTRTDGYVRWPEAVTARHEYRLRLSRQLPVPAGAPLALQFGLWGLTPRREPAPIPLEAKTLSPEYYVYLDINAAYGMHSQEYLDLVNLLFREVDEGFRPLLHQREEMFVIGPYHTRPAAGNVGNETTSTGERNPD